MEQLKGKEQQEVTVWDASRKRNEESVLSRGGGGEQSVAVAKAKKACFAASWDHPCKRVRV